MKKVFLTLTILVAFATNFLFSQSLESQLKIIFGDALSTFGKTEFSRFVGKSLSTSGNMQYTMEMIRAQNNQTLNINLPPNTYLGPSNQVMPNQGYQWANPSNPADYTVMPVSARSYPTLSPYDLNYLWKLFDGGPYKRGIHTEYNPSSLITLFTCNWAYDINGNNSFEFEEFTNVKRTFYTGEPICYAFSFVSREGSRSSGKDLGDELFFIIQLFERTTGKLIVKKNFQYHNSQGKFKHVNMNYHEFLGNYLPVGQYMVTVNLNLRSLAEGRTQTSLREYFEVLE